MSRQTKGGKVPLFHSASAVDFYKEVILPWQEMQLLKTKHRTVTTAPTKQMQPARIMQKTPTTRQLPKTTLITPQKAATQTATMRTKWSNLSLSYRKPAIMQVFLHTVSVTCGSLSFSCCCMLRNKFFLYIFCMPGCAHNRSGSFSVL